MRWQIYYNEHKISKEKVKLAGKLLNAWVSEGIKIEIEDCTDAKEAYDFRAPQNGNKNLTILRSKTHVLAPRSITMRRPRSSPAFFSPSRAGPCPRMAKVSHVRRPSHQGPPTGLFVDPLLANAGCSAASNKIRGRGYFAMKRETHRGAVSNRKEWQL